MTPYKDRLPSGSLSFYIEINRQNFLKSRDITTFYKGLRGGRKMQRVIHSTVKTNHINLALLFVRTQGILVVEVKSRGVLAVQSGQEPSIEIKCDIQTYKGTKRFTLTFTPSTITTKGGLLGLNSKILHIPNTIVNAPAYIGALYEELGLKPTTEYQPSYYVRNEILSILLQNGVTDFTIKQESIQLHSFSSPSNPDKIHYRAENHTQCSYRAKWGNSTKPQKVEGFLKSYSTFYNDLRRLLTMR